MEKKTMTVGKDNLFEEFFVRTFFAACSFTIFTVMIGVLVLLQIPFKVLYFFLEFLEIKLYHLQDAIQEWMVKK